ncbi:hypothetical protein B0T24DRAFT_671768 [Lasiosphaeria ovina]|uniref:Uncharacterized protein n=1 Tax=Lasiosphaeria ovina TaxID=92902 RepID=A0AAE0MZ26_9PEZI|nr:hypothetical protein B0T24DRAFT_671768 [Lasiosphaeria ovina]
MPPKAKTTTSNKIKVRGFEYEGNPTLIDAARKKIENAAPYTWIKYYTDTFGKIRKEIDVNLVYRELNRTPAHATPSNHPLYQKLIPGFTKVDKYLEQTDEYPTWKGFDDQNTEPTTPIPAIGGPEQWVALMILEANSDKAKKQGKGYHGPRMPEEMREAFRDMELEWTVTDDLPADFWEGSHWYSISWRNKHQKQVTFAKEADLPPINLNKLFGNWEDLFGNWEDGNWEDDTGSEDETKSRETENKGKETKTKGKETETADKESKDTKDLANVTADLAKLKDKFEMHNTTTLKHIFSLMDRVRVMEDKKKLEDLAKLKDKFEMHNTTTYIFSLMERVRVMEEQLTTHKKFFEDLANVTADMAKLKDKFEMHSTTTLKHVFNLVERVRVMEEQLATYKEKFDDFDNKEMDRKRKYEENEDQKREVRKKLKELEEEGVRLYKEYKAGAVDEEKD